MYHEEKIIDGVLCNRGTPTGEWKPYTPEALTIMLNGARARIEALKLFINDTRPVTDDLTGLDLFTQKVDA
jgi:hypothetical protein